MLQSTILRNLLAVVLPMAAVLTAALPVQANIRKVQHGSSSCSFSGHFIGLPPPVGTPGLPTQAGGTADNWVMAVHDHVSGSYIKAPHANTPESSMWAIMSCSIDRDLPLSTDGLSDLELRFIGVHPWAGPIPPGTTTQDVTCLVYSTRSDGSGAAFDMMTVAVPTLATKQTPTVMDFGSSIGASGSKGSYHVMCQMPPDVALWSIYSSEVDGINGN